MKQIMLHIGSWSIRGLFLLFWIILTYGFLLLPYVFNVFKEERSICIYMWADKIDESVEKVYAKYIPTQKNQPCSNFLNDFGFEKDNDNWVFFSEKPFKFPKNIELI